jgi:hypothetical protein
MKTFTSILAATAIAAALGNSTNAETLTVKGRVVDEGCQVKELKSKGDLTAPTEMDACAVDCAKRGEPLALLTADGKVYRIAGGLSANKNEKLIPHVNRMVQITGDVFEKDGNVVIAADNLTAAR